VASLLHRGSCICGGVWSQGGVVGRGGHRRQPSADRPEACPTAYNGSHYGFHPRWRRSAPALPMNEGSDSQRFRRPQAGLCRYRSAAWMVVPMILLMVCSLTYMLAFSSHVGWERFMRQQMESQPRCKTSRRRTASARSRCRSSSARRSDGRAVVTPASDHPGNGGVLVFVFNFMLGATVKYRQALAVTSYACLPSGLALAGGILVMFLKDPVDFDLKNRRATTSASSSIRTPCRPGWSAWAPASTSSHSGTSCCWRRDARPRRSPGRPAHRVLIRGRCSCS